MNTAIAHSTNLTFLVVKNFSATQNELATELTVDELAQVSGGMGVIGIK